MTSKNTSTGVAGSARPNQAHDPYRPKLLHFTGDASSERPGQAHKPYCETPRVTYSPGVKFAAMYPSYVGPADFLRPAAGYPFINQSGPADLYDPSINSVPNSYQHVDHPSYATASRAMKEAYWARTEEPWRMTCEATAESADDLKTRLSKAFASGAYSDLKIIVGSPMAVKDVVELNVHKVVVLTQSSVLRSMAHNTDNLFLRDDRPEIIRCLLHYLYTQEITEKYVTPARSEGNIPLYLHYFADLAFAAEKYKVDNLTKLACGKVAKILSSGGCTPAVVLDLVRRAYGKVVLSKPVRAIIFSHVLDSGLDQFLSHVSAEAMLDSSPRFFLDLLKYVAAGQGLPKGIAKGEKLNQEVGSENIEPSKPSDNAESATESNMKQHKTSLDGWRFGVSESPKKTNIAVNPTKDVTFHMQATAAMLNSGIPVYQQDAQSVNQGSESSYILSDVVGFDEPEESKLEYPQPYPIELQIRKPGKSGSHKGEGHAEDLRMEFDLPMHGNGQSKNGGYGGARCSYASTEGSEEGPEAWTEGEPEAWTEREPEALTEREPKAWTEW